MAELLKSHDHLSSPRHIRLGCCAHQPEEPMGIVRLVADCGGSWSVIEGSYVRRALMWGYERGIHVPKGSTR